MEQIKNCPKCGGTIVVSILCQYSREQRIGKRGRLLKRQKEVDCGEMDVRIAYCSNNSCDVRWEADEFYIKDERFIDLKYSE